MLQILRSWLPLLKVTVGSWNCSSGPYGRRKVLIKLFSELASVNCFGEHSLSLLGTGLQLPLGSLGKGAEAMILFVRDGAAAVIRFVWGRAE